MRDGRHRSLFSNPTRIGTHRDEASITVQRTEYRILCSNIQRHFHEYSVRRRTSRSEGFCNGPAPAPIMVTGIRYRELHARSRVCAARGDKMSFSRTRCPKRQHREEKPKRMASPTQRHPEFNQPPSRPPHRSPWSRARAPVSTKELTPAFAERRGLRLSGRRLAVPKREAPR